MRITASAITLNVDDVPASAAFAMEHFGFREEMADDGFDRSAVQGRRPSTRAGLNVSALGRSSPQRLRRRRPSRRHSRRRPVRRLEWPRTAWMAARAGR
jgi:hypothetical protein